MKKFSGIDLHSNNSFVVITDDSDRVLYSRRLPNELALIIAALEAHRAELVGVVVESTFNWYWLVDGLMAAGFSVHLANPSAIKKYEGLKHCGDEADAAYLAQLLRLGLLKEGYIYPQALRAVRDLARKRAQLVRYRSAQILAVENILSLQRGGRLRCEEIKRLTEPQIEAMSLSWPVAMALKAHIAIMATLDEQIERLERALQGQVRLSRDYQVLKSAPGIGEILATTIMLETGEIGRFAQVGHYSSYCRCVDSRYESNGKKKGEGNVKNGNAYLAWAYVEAAHYARRFCPQARAFYERKRRQRNAIVASKALAHKLSRACYHMLRTQEPFDVKRCFS
jgi:transposase